MLVSTLAKPSDKLSFLASPCLYAAPCLDRCHNQGEGLKQWMLAVKFIVWTKHTRKPPFPPPSQSWCIYLTIHLPMIGNWWVGLFMNKVMSILCFDFHSPPSPHPTTDFDLQSPTKIQYNNLSHCRKSIYPEYLNQSSKSKNIYDMWRALPINTKRI